MVGERDQLATQARTLRQKVVRLEASNRSLSAELNATLDRYEDLNVERDSLDVTVATLRSKETQLASELDSNLRSLRDTEQKLATTSAEVERLNSTYDHLVADLEQELAAGQIEIEQLREGIRVAVSDEILFASGSSTIDELGRDVLLKLAERLNQLDHAIEVQGHTDNQHISGRLAKRYPSNWDLAAARASSVVRLMQEQGIEGDRLSVTSFAEFRPLVGNDNPQDRSLNRRIEIRLQPRRERSPASPPEVSSGLPPEEGSAHGGAAKQGDEEDGVTISGRDIREEAEAVEAGAADYGSSDAPSQTPDPEASITARPLEAPRTDSGP